jgi:hypothetical protein
VIVDGIYASAARRSASDRTEESLATLLVLLMSLLMGLLLNRLFQLLQRWIGEWRESDYHKISHYLLNCIHATYFNSKIELP